MDSVQTDLAGFTALADLLRPTACSLASAQPREVLAEPAQLPVESPRAQLQVDEFFERACIRLLRRFAEDVLARELALAPVDIAALAQRALEAFSEEEPLALTVAAQDAARLEVALPLRVDDALQPGDLIVDVRAGRLESPLRLRVEQILTELSAIGSSAEGMCL